MAEQTAEKPAAEKAPEKKQEKPEISTEFGRKCSSCNKPIKRQKRYYRNGAYYCNKNCFKKKTKQTPKAQAPA